MAGERAASGAMKRPSCKLSRHTSGADPATSSSAGAGEREGFHDYVHVVHGGRRGKAIRGKKAGL